MADALAAALRDCRKSAEEGYQQASKAYEAVHAILAQAEENLKTAEASQAAVERGEKTWMIERQQRHISELQRADQQLKLDLDHLWKQEKVFSILVFGKTMAGKSTMMEILTHGKGASIGPGSQRTTRVTRHYEWKGMRVTDVPGTCSFDGREDDALAMEAAKEADLIIFLITDDAPQMEEARPLMELRALGKSVLGIVNVKVNLNLSRRKLALHDLAERMKDKERIDKIRHQFCLFGKELGQDWSQIPFVYTHLRAAYLGRDDAEVFALSNFARVEEVLIDKVVHEANLLRTKNFLNGISVPLSHHVEALFDDAANLLEEADVYEDQKKKLLAWSTTFEVRSQEKIERFMKNLKSQVDDAIEDFSEDADEDDDEDELKEKLKDALDRVQLERQCKKLMQSLVQDLHTMSDDIVMDMKPSPVKMNVNEIDFDVEMNFDTLFGLAGAAAFVFLSGGWGLLAGALSTLLSIGSDSKSQKREQAREKLRKDLRKKLHPKLGKLKKKLIACFETDIMQKGIHGFADALDEREDILLLLAKQQSTLAARLNQELAVLSKTLLKKTMEQAFQNEKIFLRCKHVVRLPGKEMIAVGTTNLMPEQVWKLEEWLDEPLHILPVEEEGDGERTPVQAILGQSLLQAKAWQMHQKTFDAGKAEGRRKKQQIRYLRVDKETAQQKHWADVKRMLQQAFACPVILEDRTKAMK